MIYKVVAYTIEKITNRSIKMVVIRDDARLHYPYFAKVLYGTEKPGKLGGELLSFKEDAINKNMYSVVGADIYTTRRVRYIDLRNISDESSWEKVMSFARRFKEKADSMVIGGPSSTTSPSTIICEGVYTTKQGTFPQKYGYGYAADYSAVLSTNSKMFASK